MKTNDFNFELAEELIAKYPLEQRSNSRLLWLHPKGITHHRFIELADLLQPDDLLVFNNTQVIPARLFATKETGGKVEILIERVVSANQALAHVGSNKSLKVGTKLFLADGSLVVVQAKAEGLFHLFFGTQDVYQLLDRIGTMPLPHYMRRSAEHIDINRYQTVYASKQGAVAAPTAGLHFDEAVFQALKAKGINHTFLTLHVGAGTFKPVLVDDFRQHIMHKESIEIPSEVCDVVNAQKARGGRVIAVGTTAVRALETAMQKGSKLQPYSGDTDIFIYPGYSFQCVDGLITNFHLPRSTLLMLVCAFGGFKEVMTAYQIAIENRYRFYSYGDAMLLTKDVRLRGEV